MCLLRTVSCAWQLWCLRCKAASGPAPFKQGPQAVGDVPGEVIEACATLLFAAVKGNYGIVLWQHLTSRLHPGQNRQGMLKALGVFGEAGVVAAVEVEVERPNAGENVGQEERRKRRKQVVLQMTEEVSLPIVAVKRGGQDSFPSFKLKPVDSWPANEILDAVKAEHGRRDAARHPSSK